MSIWTRELALVWHRGQWQRPTGAAAGIKRGGPLSWSRSRVGAYPWHVQYFCTNKGWCPARGNINKRNRILCRPAIGQLDLGFPRGTRTQRPSSRPNGPPMSPRAGRRARRHAFAPPSRPIREALCPICAGFYPSALLQHIPQCPTPSPSVQRCRRPGGQAANPGNGAPDRPGHDTVHRDPISDCGRTARNHSKRRSRRPRPSLL